MMDYAAGETFNPNDGIVEVNEPVAACAYAVGGAIAGRRGKIAEVEEDWDAVEHNIPLDDFDYELAKRADERGTEETVSFDEMLQKCGLTYADLQD